MYVWCSAATGCGTRAFQECWLKRAEQLNPLQPTVRSTGGAFPSGLLHRRALIMPKSCTCGAGPAGVSQGLLGASVCIHSSTWAAVSHGQAPRLVAGVSPRRGQGTCQLRSGAQAQQPQAPPACRRLEERHQVPARRAAGRHAGCGSQGAGRGGQAAGPAQQRQRAPRLPGRPDQGRALRPAGWPLSEPAAAPGAHPGKLWLVLRPACWPCLPAGPCLSLLKLRARTLGSCGWLSHSLSQRPPRRAPGSAAS